MLGKIADSDHAYGILKTAIEKSDPKDLLAVFSKSEVLLGKIANSGHAYGILKTAIEKSDPKDLLAVLRISWLSKIIDSKRISLLSKIIGSKDAYGIIMLSIEKFDPKDLLAVFSESEVLLGEITDSDHAYGIFKNSYREV